MKKTFFEFEAFKPVRLVWEKGPAEGQSAPPAAAETKAETPATEVKPNPKVAEDAQKAAKASEATEQEHTSTAANAEFEAIMAAHKDKPEEVAAELVKLKPEELQAIKTALATEATEADKKAFPISDLEAVSKKFDAGKFTPSEIVILCTVLAEKSSDPKAKELAEKTAKWLDELRSALEIQKQKVIFAEIDKTFKKYPDKYEKYLEAAKKATDEATSKKAKEDFLASITDDKDRETLRFALDESTISKEEQNYVEKYVLRGKKLPPKEIAEKEMSYRESIVALSLITPADIKKLKLTPAEAERIGAIRKAMETAKRTAGSSIPEALKGVGIVGLIEKLVEQITKLIEKLSGQINKAFGIEKGKQFDISPLVGNGSFTLSKEEGKPGVYLKPTEGASREVQSISDGTVESVDKVAGTVIVKAGGGKIIYGNLEDIKVEPNDPVVVGGVGAKPTPLGTIRGEAFNFQILNTKGVQKDPTELLSKFTEEPKVETPSTTPAVEPKVDEAKPDAKAPETKAADAPAAGANETKKQ
jgi:hypothetical protein